MSVPCSTWVPRGKAQSRPTKVVVDKEELHRLIKETSEALDEVESNNENDSDDMDVTDSSVHAQSKCKKDQQKDSDDIVDKYGLDDYDEDDDDYNPLSGIGEYAQYATNDDDPYITLKSEDDSDEEDFEIQPTDNLLICGRAMQEQCMIEVYVYNEEKGNLYVHHDYFLPTFPLALEWLNFEPSTGSSGNFVALGSMDPVIEVWNIDVVDSLEPQVYLGTKKKKKKMEQKGSAVGHSGAVLDLSWNTVQRNALASASADYSIGLWDLLTLQMVSSVQHHTEKVQCVEWHPFEAETLLSGSFDQTVKVFDCRNPHSSVKTWKLLGEVERIIWDRFSPIHFLASDSNGNVFYYDIRQEKPLFTLSAHNKAVTGLALSSQISGLLVTTSEDKFMKVWDIQDMKPSMVFERNLRLSELHFAKCCPDAPFVFSFGGSGDPKIWDIRESAAVRRHFQGRMPEKLAAECEGDDQDIDEEEEETKSLETLVLDKDGSLAMATECDPSKKVKKKKKIQVVTNSDVKNAKKKKKNRKRKEQNDRKTLDA